MKLSYHKQSIFHMGFVYVVLVFVMSCTQTAIKDQQYENDDFREDRAKTAIIDFWGDTLPNADSILITKFSQLDSSFTNLLDDSEYVKLALISQSLLDSFDKVYEGIVRSKQIYKDSKLIRDTSNLKGILSKIDSINIEMMEISDSFKKMYQGWVITNEFKVRNAIVKGTYFLDSTATAVVRFIDDYSKAEYLRNFEHRLLQREFFLRHSRYSSIIDSWREKTWEH